MKKTDKTEPCFLKFSSFRWFVGGRLPGPSKFNELAVLKSKFVSELAAHECKVIEAVTLFRTKHMLRDMFSILLFNENFFFSVLLKMIMPLQVSDEDILGSANIFMESATGESGTSFDICTPAHLYAVHLNAKDMASFAANDGNIAWKPFTVKELVEAKGLHPYIRFGSLLALDR